MSKLLDDCFVHDKQRLRHDEALAILKGRIRPVAGTERVKLAEAAGRILAEPAVARAPVPAHTNAAVDGYSFAAADYDRGKRGASSPSRAGRRLGIRWSAAPAPRDSGAHLHRRGHAGGPRHRRHAGGRRPAHVGWPDAGDHPGRPEAGRQRAQGRRGREGRRDACSTAGAVLRPQDLAALASIGIAEVACFTRLQGGDRLDRRRGGARRAGRSTPARCTTPTRRCWRALVASAGARRPISACFPDNLEAVKQRLAEAARAVRRDHHLGRGQPRRGGPPGGRARCVGQAAPVAARHQARPADVVRPDRRLRGAGAAGQSGGGVRVLPALRVAAAAAHGRGGVARAAALPAAGPVRLPRSQDRPARVLARHAEGDAARARRSTSSRATARA